MSGAIKERIIEGLRGAGACAVGVAVAEPVPDDVWCKFEAWLDAGHGAGMRYMRNHAEIRCDPRLLLPGARSIICVAFCYDRGLLRDESLPEISYYALFPDYHEWVRALIRNSGISELLGTECIDWRICVDSAPIMERYWANKSGIGIIGDNGAIIVPGVGNRVILTEIVSTLQLEPDSPATGDCGHCGQCRHACPTGALLADGTIDCNRCLSYLTIEHRGEWIDQAHRQAMATAEGRKTLFGCDRCMTACPHNKPKCNSKSLPEPLPQIVNLTTTQILESSADTLRHQLKGTALKRTKIDDLIRNAHNLLSS